VSGAGRAEPARLGRALAIGAFGASVGFGVRQRARQPEDVVTSDGDQRRRPGGDWTAVGTAGVIDAPCAAKGSLSANDALIVPEPCYPASRTFQVSSWSRSGCIENTGRTAGLPWVADGLVADSMGRLVGGNAVTPRCPIRARCFRTCPFLPLATSMS